MNDENNNTSTSNPRLPVLDPELLQFFPTYRHHVMQFCPWPCKVDINKLEDCVHQLLMHYPILRSVPNDEKTKDTMAVILPIDDCKFHVQSIDALSADTEITGTGDTSAVVRRINELIRAQRATLDGSIPPPRFQLYTIDQLFDQPYLLLVMEHLIADGPSTAIFFKQLERVYNGQSLENHEKPVRQTSSDLNDYQLVRQRAAAKSVAWRDNIVAHSLPLTPRSDISCKSEQSHELVVALGENTAPLLKERAKSLGVPATSMLLSAITLALYSELKINSGFILGMTDRRTKEETYSIGATYSRLAVLDLAIDPHESLTTLIQRLTARYLQACIHANNNLELSRQNYGLVEDCLMLSFEDFHLSEAHGFHRYVGNTDRSDHQIISLASILDSLTNAEIRFQMTGQRWYVRGLFSERQYSQQAANAFTERLLRMIDMLKKIDLLETVDAAIQDS